MIKPVLKIKILLILFIAFCFFIPLSTYAKSFVFHFYFDQKANVLNFDKFQTEQVNVVGESKESISDLARNPSKGNYIIKLKDEKKRDIFDYEFDISHGAFDVFVPYFSLANSADILKKSNQAVLLSVDLRSFSTCNNNGLCEYEKKETMKSCIPDCASSNISYSKETQELLNQNNKVIKDQETGEVLISDIDPIIEETVEEKPEEEKSNLKNILVLIFGIALLLFATIAFFIYRKKTKE
jgi:hypothetical protein